MGHYPHSMVGVQGEGKRSGQPEISGLEQTQEV